MQLTLGRHLVTADIVICLTEIVFSSSCASTEAERAGHPPGGQGLRGTVESALFKGPKVGDPGGGDERTAPSSGGTSVGMERSPAHRSG